MGYCLPLMIVRLSHSVSLSQYAIFAYLCFVRLRGQMIGERGFFNSYIMLHIVLRVLLIPSGVHGVTSRMRLVCICAKNKQAN